MVTKLDKTKLNELQIIFLGEAEKYFAANKDVEWGIIPIISKKNYYYEIEAKPCHHGSYAVKAQANPWEIDIVFDDWHQHFNPEEGYGSKSKTCEAALAIMDAILHGECKLIINKASGKPYKWTLYCNYFGEWRRYSSLSNFWWSFFGRYSKEELINKKKE